MENVIGKTYGLLTVLAETKQKGYNRYVLVRCNCESIKSKIVYLGDLRRGHTTSCGCVQKAVVRSARTAHGLYKHRLYGIWAQMLSRCQNPKASKYENYGGRGIAVCKSWQTLENFLADMGPTYAEGLSLERKDNSKGYNPENCEWATRAEQNRNKRSNINITLNGKTQCFKDWCAELGLNYGTAKARMSRGKTPEQALQIQKNST